MGRGGGGGRGGHAPLLRNILDEMVIFIAAMGQVFESRLRKVYEVPVGEFDLVRTMHLGMGSQGACEDCTKSLIPHA